jgi:hypothetical protein
VGVAVPDAHKEVYVLWSAAGLEAVRAALSKLCGGSTFVRARYDAKTGVQIKNQYLAVMWERRADQLRAIAATIEKRRALQKAHRCPAQDAPSPAAAKGKAAAGAGEGNEDAPAATAAAKEKAAAGAGRGKAGGSVEIRPATVERVEPLPLDAEYDLPVPGLQYPDSLFLRLYHHRTRAGAGPIYDVDPDAACAHIRDELLPMLAGHGLVERQHVTVQKRANRDSLCVGLHIHFATREAAELHTENQPSLSAAKRKVGGAAQESAASARMRPTETAVAYVRHLIHNARWPDAILHPDAKARNYFIQCDFNGRTAKPT